MVTNPCTQVQPVPLLCARCTAPLRPGAGDFFQVTIEAVADPTPPVVSERDLAGDLRGQIEQLLARMTDLSEREALDQVYRRLTLHLCGPCYRAWIEDPTGLRGEPSPRSGGPFQDGSVGNRQTTLAQTKGC